MPKLKICTNCGFTWDEFLTRRVLGCAQCYGVFKKEIREYLAELHGEIKHLSQGDQPVKQSPKREFEQLAQLREKLSEAVRQEKFEDALKIKQQISRLENQNGTS